VLVFSYVHWSLSKVFKMIAYSLEVFRDVIFFTGFKVERQHLLEECACGVFLFERKTLSNEIACHLVRLSYLAESAAIQQCFSLTTNQRTVFSATIN
jgi:hypothetical protein